MRRARNCSAWMDEQLLRESPSRAKMDWKVIYPSYIRYFHARIRTSAVRVPRPYLYLRTVRFCSSEARMTLMMIVMMRSNTDDDTEAAQQQQQQQRARFLFIHYYE